MSDVTIAYFEARARVEPIRVILEELAIPYEDQRISFETWLEMKSHTPFGALPSYRRGDLEIFQSHAIIRHLARVSPPLVGGIKRLPVRFTPTARVGR